MVVSYTSSNAYVFDIESNKIITKLESKVAEGKFIKQEDEHPY